MLWGIPIWIWLVFFVSRFVWIALGGILWIYFFPRVLWNKKIEEKYFGHNPASKWVDEKEPEKR